MRPKLSNILQTFFNAAFIPRYHVNAIYPRPNKAKTVPIWLHECMTIGLSFCIFSVFFAQFVYFIFFIILLSCELIFICLFWVLDVHRCWYLYSSIILSQSYSPWRYSVMQSDGNSFCGDVVLDSFNKASRDEVNILNQIYKSTYLRLFTMKVLFFITFHENAYKYKSSYKTQYLEFFVLECCITLVVHFLQSILN